MEEERVVLLLGLQYSGKSMFADYMFDGSFHEYTPTVRFKEIPLGGDLLLVEYGGTVVKSWKALFKNSPYRGRVFKVLLFVDGSFDECLLEETRSVYLSMLYYFKELQEVPLCVVQHNATADDAPAQSWKRVKEKLQLRLLLQRGFCSGKILVIRLVYSEPDALQKNTERILQWIIH